MIFIVQERWRTTESARFAQCCRFNASDFNGAWIPCLWRECLATQHWLAEIREHYLVVTCTTSNTNTFIWSSYTQPAACAGHVSADPWRVGLTICHGPDRQTDRQTPEGCLTLTSINTASIILYNKAIYSAKTRILAIRNRSRVGNSSTATLYLVLRLVTYCTCTL